MISSHFKIVNEYDYYYNKIKTHTDILTSIASSSAALEGDVDQVINNLIETVSKELSIDRVSYWIQSKIYGFKLFDALLQCVLIPIQLQLVHLTILNIVERDHQERIPLFNDEIFGDQSQITAR